MSRTRRSRPQRRPDRAQVQRFRPQNLDGTFVTRERAVLPCGCSIFVGRDTTNNNKVGTRAQPCAEEHQMITDMANELLLRSLASPTKRLLVDVCRDLLSQAARAIL